MTSFSHRGCLFRFAAPMDDHGQWELAQKEWCFVTVEGIEGSSGIEVISLLRLEQETRQAWRDNRLGLIEDPTIVLDSVDLDMVIAALCSYCDQRSVSSSSPEQPRS